MSILAKFFIFVLLSGMVLGGKIHEDSPEGGELFFSCFFSIVIIRKVYVIISQWELKVEKSKQPKGGKTRMTKPYLNGSEDGASFLDQSLSKIKQNQSSCRLISTPN